MTLHRGFLAWVCLMATGFGASAQAGAASALAEQTALAPENLIRSFAGFTFELNAQPQDAETFLKRKCGDCDDFANLASRLLTDRGYKTKLVVVMMEQQTHVVCYVKEAHGFLDFNHRADARPIIESDGSLEDIAQRVAGDFRQQWLTASEFRYENTSSVCVETVFPAAAGSKKVGAAVTPAVDHDRQGTNDLASVNHLVRSPYPAELNAPSESAK